MVVFTHYKIITITTDEGVHIEMIEVSGIVTMSK